MVYSIIAGTALHMLFSFQIRSQATLWRQLVHRPPTNSPWDRPQPWLSQTVSMLLQLAVSMIMLLLSCTDTS